MEQKQHFITRRGVIRSFGIAGAAAISSPFIQAGSRAQAALLSSGLSRTSKLGLLLPSGRMQMYSSSFMNGLSLSLLEAGKNIPSVTPFSEHDCLYFKLDQLLREEKPDTVIGLVNTRQSNGLKPLVEKAKVNFIEANLGENFFHKELTSAQFFHSSMNLWQAHYVLGQWAAANSAKEAISVSSFIDSGYDALYAFTNGFESSGGKITGTIISGNPAENISPVEAAALVAQSQAKIVFVNYSFTDAAIFLSAFKAAPRSGSKKIFASSMMIQPRLAKFIGDDLIGVISASTWTLEGTQGSAEFGARYRTKYNLEADDFAVLGYDTAAMVSSQSLENATFASARGSSAIVNAATHGTESPVYIIEMARPDDGHIIAKTGLPSEITRASYRLVEEMRSGGSMPYPAM
jgi:ABC-type branched-subunit amino acid transport system substrate-binding protein